ncbi:DUF5689 domain-containing protein [Aquimarina pacifica]|uniref:DUF5689 domain-containing protein n=1 Tax=Aquimarina pacifica TaxID=1296415 RepID=UPI0004704AE8|nr:DUF5689 domain-containing protein [Aquimarina pacifica]
MNLYLKTSFFLISILVCISMIRCVHEEEFQIPTGTIEDPKIEETIITIDALLGILGQKLIADGENGKVVFDNTNTAIEGYVVSSDKAGNFFKEIIVQDKSIHPSAGVRVLVDDAPLYTTFEFGRKVYVKLDGLSIGIENGVPTLGVLEGNTIKAISSFSIKDQIVRSSEIQEIVPLEIRIEDFSDTFLNVYVKLSEVQFNKSMITEDNVFTFAAEVNDEYDGERIIESCISGRSVIISTSVYSDFGGSKLPTGTGALEGILTKNYEGEIYNLVLNDPTQMVFDSEIRCDPIVLDCPFIVEGLDFLFEENFTDLKIGDLEDLGWINHNIYNGQLTYKMGAFDNNDYAQITGYRSGEPLYEVWLITPEIDLSSSMHESLYFDVQAAYDTGNILEVFVTNNFLDTIANTTWTKLDVLIPRSAIEGFGDFESLGPISLSCLDEKVRIGFRYTGGDPKATTRYHIDELRVMGKKQSE